MTSARVFEVLSGRGGLALLTLLVVVVGVLGVGGETYLNGSMLWTQHLASIFWAHPMEVAFLPGASPLSAALYSPVAAIGLETFAYAHMLVGAITVVLVGRVAAARGVPIPNLAALVMATSAVFVVAGAAGVVGSDAALLTALGLYLLDVTKRPSAAGFVFGLLTLLRPELAVIGLGLAITRGSIAVGIGTLGVFGLYLTGGALLAADSSFVLRVLGTPALAGPAKLVIDATAMHTILLAVVAACPAIGLLGASRPSLASSEDRSDALVAALFTIVVVAMGVLDVGRVGLSPERLLPALPLACPLLARAIGGVPDRDHGERTVALLAALLLVAGIAAELAGDLTLVAVVGAWATLVAVARLWPKAALPLVTATAIVGALTLAPAAGLKSTEQVPDLVHTILETRNAPQLVEGQQIVTDAILLAHVIGERTEGVRFCWHGRTAAPLGDLDDVSWALDGHPFGEPALVTAPAELEPFDVAMIVDPDLIRTYEAYPELTRRTFQRTSIFERRVPR